MNSPLPDPSRSDRCSDRVESAHAVPPEIRAHQPSSAPENYVPQRGTYSSPGPSARTKPNQPAHRFSRDQVERIGRRLSKRDYQILHTVHAHRMLTTDQLRRFHFTEFGSDAAAARVCRRSLNRLHNLGVIEHLQRRVGGERAGSASYVWRVGLVGDRLLKLGDSHAARARRKEPSLRHLEHCLAIAETHLQLREVSTTSDRFQLVSVTTEPGNWRPYRMASGETSICKPDLAVITASGDYEDHWFIEVDRGTESLPTLLMKCQQYLEYRTSGREQERFGVFPRVIWIMPTSGDADRLAAAIARSTQLPPTLFRIITQAELADTIERGAV